ncbi:MAG TPA: oligosaccharide flippase family protein [Bryobacteraceae bacterium]|nr:oligosaccharide flippase family protein [Bryobacteraceae bacterium]
MSTAPASSPRSLFVDAFRGTLVYSIPYVGQRAVGILVLAVVTRVLTRDDFGMLSLLEQVGSVLSILLCGSFSASLGYFYFRKDLLTQRARVVGTVILGSVLLGVGAASISWPASGFLAEKVFRSRDALRYLPLVFLSMPFDFGLEAFYGWLRVENLQTAFARISLLKIALAASGIVVLVGVFKMQVMAYLGTNLCVNAIVTAILVAYLFRRARPSASFSLFVEMFRFSVPLGLSLIAMFVVNFGDQFVLRQYRSLAEVGVYALAYRLGMVVALAYQSFHTYWAAQVYGILQREDADPVFARLFTYASLLLCLCVLILTLGAKPGLRLLVAPDFRAAAPLIPVLAGANAIRSVSEFLRCRFLAAGRPAYKTYIDWAGLAVSLTLYFLLIPRLGMWGGAIATLGTFVVMALLSIVGTYWMDPYKVESARLLKMGTVFAVILILYYLVPVSSFVAQAAWSSLLLALFPVGLWGLRFPTEGERQTLRSALYAVVSRHRRSADA